ncbi:MAG: biotin/lipoate A/B protein ligase family protein [Candidatus Woesearchaeota archaeon]
MKKKEKERFRLLNLIETNGFMQMAIDEAILEARIKDLVPNTIRFYTWNPKCVSIGYFQSLEKEVNIEKAKREGVDVVRRITGGGAVFHDKELTYSIVVSENLVSHDVLKSYEKICNAIIRGLEFLGVKAVFKLINDIVVDEKKISGNAQTRRQNIILQHGTILLDVDVKRMFSLLKVPDEKIRDKIISSVEERVTSLKRILNREIKPEDLRINLIRGFQDVFDVEVEEKGLTDYEINLSKKLFKNKYSTKEWNFLR